jgi:DNA topoisomerase II
VEEIARRVNKRGKANSSAVANFQIKNHLKVFVNCLIENPAFDSQTKETMKTVPSKFGSACDIKKKFFDDL